MDDPFFLILLILIISCTFGTFLLTVSALVFREFMPDKIISLLREAGFNKLSNRLKFVVEKIGKQRPYDSFCKEGKIWDKAWKKFRKLKIPKEFKALRRLQLIEKAIFNLFLFVVVMFLLVPVFFVVLTIYARSVN
jgi:hypothetical protein